MTATRALRPVETMSADERCATCGVPITTPFCPACGEQRPGDRHYTLAHFSEEVIETFTHADGRIWRTLVALVMRPGALTVAYMRGERKAYVAPLQLFLILNVALFVAGALGIGARTFDTPLWVQMHIVHNHEVVNRLVMARVAARGTTLAAYTELFDHATTTLAKSLVIVLVPAFAAAVAIITIRRRAFAVQHIVFSLHAIAMLFIVGTVTTAALLGAFAVTRGAIPGFTRANFDALATPVVVLWFGTYIALSLRRAYATGWAWSAASGLILMVVLANLLAMYRILLFYATFWTT